MKARQAEQLGSIDDVHPLKQVAIMSIIQVLMLAIVGVGMFFIGLNYPDKEIPINYIDDVSNEQTKTIS